MRITEYNEAKTMQMFQEEYLAKGRREGENRLGQLMELLLSKGMAQEAQKAAADETVRAALYEKYGISGSSGS